MGAVASTTITLGEFCRLPDAGVQHEVNAGALLTSTPAKSLHTLIAISVLEILQTYLRGREATALPEAGYLLCADPLTIRQPDVSVLSKHRIAATAADSYFEGAPELAIEIISSSDTAVEIEIKVRQYLQYGATQVWLLYPRTKDIHVFHANSSATILGASQTLDACPVLPGFSVPGLPVLRYLIWRYC